MNRQCSMPYVVAVCLASVAAVALAGAVIGQYIFDKVTGGKA